MISTKTDKKQITRKCVYTNQILPIDQLIRIAKNKDNSIKIDWNNQLKGRGAYIIKNKAIILEALNRKVLHRAFKMNVSQNIYQTIITEVENYGW